MDFFLEQLIQMELTVFYCIYFITKRSYWWHTAPF